ncbi:hypothetical protein SRHO_G00020420 [Serrasalmus rhombeus]
MIMALCGALFSLGGMFSSADEDQFQEQTEQDFLSFFFRSHILRCMKEFVERLSSGIWILSASTGQLISSHSNQFCVRPNGFLCLSA